MAAHRPEYLAGQVEVTSRCFQACLGCDSWREDLKGKSSGEWTLEQMQALTRQLRARRKFKHLSLTGGDPQAWKHLDAYLRWHGGEGFTLQLNTALTQDIADPELWKQTIADFRVSLDGVTEETYNAIRGRSRPMEVDGKRSYVEGAATAPEHVIQRMIDLQHPGLTTNTTVFHQNIHEARAILLRLIRAVQHEGLKLRKAHFMAAIGDRGPRDVLQVAFLEEWQALRALAQSAPFETNIAESPLEVRKYLASTPEALEIPCYAGGISFHIKCNGDLYPCCLVGGEALETHREFCLGNVHELTLAQIETAYKPRCDYADPNKPCRNICQWKQLQINAAAHMAATDRLVMP